MNLNTILLKERLMDTYPKMEFFFLSETTWQRPLLYEPGMTLQPGHIHIMTGLPPSQPSSHATIVMIFPDTCHQPEDYEDYGPCFILHGTDTPLQVLNFLQTVFDRYEQWEQTISQALLEGRSIQQLLLLALPLLGCPICLLSRGFSLIAFAGEELLPQEYQIFNDSDRTIDYINSMKQNDFYNQSQDFKEPYIFPAQLTGIRSWNVNIQQSGHTAYRLMMLEYPRTLTQGDSYLLLVLSKYIEYLLYHSDYRTSQENTLHSVFLSVLSDSSADYMGVSQQLSSLGWHSDHQYMSMVLETTLLDQQNLTTNAVCSYIEELLPASCSIPYKENIVVFFNLTRLQLDEETTADKLACFIRDSYFKAGYSRSMKGHMNLRRQYLQACLALDVGSRHNPHLWIHHFNQIALYYFLEQSTRQLPVCMLCHEGLLRLRETDDRQGTKYMLTLRTYLKNHMNAVQSSKDLFIHRSTFLYRLDKIKDILETDFEDNYEILYLLLSYQLLDMEKSQTWDH